MLFMGEEYSEPHPFLYFVSHTDPELAEAVRKGRKAEFAAFHAQGEAPDPMAEETFQESKLQWELLQQEPHLTMFQYYQNLISLRKAQPALYHLNRQQLAVKFNEEIKTLVLQRWHENQEVVCLLNFSVVPQTVTLPTSENEWQLLLNSADPKWHGPAAAHVSVFSGADVTLQPESILIYSNL